MRYLRFLLLAILGFSLILAPTPIVLATSPIEIEEKPEWYGSIQQFDQPINYTADWVNDILNGIFDSFSEMLTEIFEGFVSVFDDFKDGTFIENPFFYALVFIILCTILLLFKRFG